jgi:hypothetical protein
VKMTTELHLVPRLRMRNAMPPLPSVPSWRAQGQFHLCAVLFAAPECRLLHAKSEDAPCLGGECLNTVLRANIVSVW